VVSPFSWAAAEPSDTPLAAAYAACAHLVRQHDGLFAVRSRLLAPDTRPHVAAIYAFAFAAGDFADEGEHSDAERECLLDDWLHRLRAAARGESGDDPASVFAAIGHTVRAHQLPVQLFEDVIGAFRQDVLTKRYGTWGDLQDYCRRAANPVGRLVLRVSGHDDPGLDRASDALTTALELTSRWRNLAREWRKGRLYVPREDLEAFGARETDLDEGRITQPWRTVLAALAGRTRALFAEGRQLCDAVTGRLRFDLRVSWLRGMMVLDRLERSGFDVFGARPALGPFDVPLLLWRAGRWRPSP
jgi:hydroxysqualene synthase